MKTSVITAAIVLLGLLAHAQSPNWNEWLRQKATQRRYLLQQIAALKVYLQYLKKGYEIVDKGLTTIGEIKHGTWNLDKDYFNSLKQVSPVIRDSPKVNAILIYQQEIRNELRALIAYCKASGQYTSTEIKYLQALYRSMVNEGNIAVDELTLITTAGSTEMTDDKRLLRLDQLHHEMINQYAFTTDFASRTRLLAAQRSKEQHELHSLRSLLTKP